MTTHVDVGYDRSHTTNSPFPLIISSSPEKTSPLWHHDWWKADEKPMPAIEADKLGRLYRQHAPALRLYARQWPECGDDCVQDAFVELARQVDSPEQIVPWLYRVVRNKALAASRKSSRLRRRESRASRPEAWFAGVDDQVDAQDALRHLAGLTLELREVIVSRIWGGLTFEEIGKLVGCSLATAQRRYQAGLKELSERLEGRWTRNPPVAT